VSKKITLVYDPVLKQPGCVLLQAAYGCNGHDLQRHLPDAEWLLAPTKDMGRYTATEEQWAFVNKKSKQRRKL